MENSDFSLNSLEDIILAPQPSLWPPAPGVWLLLVVGCCLAAVGFYIWYSRYKDNAYRRAGLVLLADAKTRREMDIILKRVGLAAFPRQTVAPLYGMEWLQFLDATCKNCRFSALSSLPDGELAAQYRHCAADWIKYHKRL